MKTFKITNVSNLAGKRDSKFNMSIDIEYVDNRTKKIIQLKAGETVFLTVGSLPLSTQRLRIKKLITIEEISLVEQNKLREKSKPQPITSPKSAKKVVFDKTGDSEIEKKEQLETEKKTNVKKKAATE